MCPIQGPAPFEGIIDCPAHHQMFACAGVEPWTTTCEAAALVEPLVIWDSCDVSKWSITRILRNFMKGMVQTDTSSNFSCGLKKTF